MSDIRTAVVAKLNPGVIRVSPKFTAILAFLLDQEGWTDPAITELCITSDGILMAATTYDRLMDSIEGAASDLDRNMRGVAKAAKLTRRETTWFLATKAHIKDWRQRPAFEAIGAYDGSGRDPQVVLDEFTSKLS